MAKRGRPQLKATNKNKKKVAEMLAEEIAIADIAKVLDLSVPTFRKLYRAELISGKKKKVPAANKFRATAVHRKKVERHVACKTPLADICRLIGCTEEQLRANFPDELATGRVKYRDKVIDHLETQMAAGNTSATNRLEALTALPPPEKDDAGSSGAASEAPAAHVVGKKAAARAAAANAASRTGNKFAPPPPPKLVVNNGD